MKEYIKPELDVIEIKASDIYTESGGNGGNFDLGQEDDLIS